MDRKEGEPFSESCGHVDAEGYYLTHSIWHNSYGSRQPETGVRSHAATIVQVIFGGLGTGPTEVVIQQDKSIRTDTNGMSESQGYRFEADTNATRRHFTKRKNGRWIEKGASQKNGTVLMIGERDTYHDYGF